jgi:hypothetical protein
MMTGKKTTTYLRDLCRALDESALLPRVRRAAVVAAIPASLLLSACDIGGGTPMYGVREYPADEICNNETDDDNDGRADCDDSDCASLEICLGCLDGQDNDGNEAADCNDPTCENTEPCLGSCDDEQDNDGDYLVDCQDYDCAGVAPCE